MKKTVGIFLFDNVEVLDFAGPFEVFSVTGELNPSLEIEVVTIAKTLNLITTVNGLLIQPRFSISNHPPIDIFIIPGGNGSRHLLEDVELLQWMMQTYQTSNLSISICSGARVPAALGLLNNAPFCTHHGVYADIAKIAPQSIPQKELRYIKTNNKLYTAAGISAGIDVSFHVIEQLYGLQRAQNTATYMEYKLEL